MYIGDWFRKTYSLMENFGQFYIFWSSHKINCHQVLVCHSKFTITKYCIIISYAFEFMYTPCIYSNRKFFLCFEEVIIQSIFLTSCGEVRVKKRRRGRKRKKELTLPHTFFLLIKILALIWIANDFKIYLLAVWVPRYHQQKNSEILSAL